MLQAAFFYLHVTRERLPKKTSVQKGACKTLIKLTPGDNFNKTVFMIAASKKASLVFFTDRN
jgi:hypothetical protein